MVMLIKDIIRQIIEDDACSGEMCDVTAEKIMAVVDYHYVDKATAWDKVQAIQEMYKSPNDAREET